MQSAESLASSYQKGQEIDIIDLDNDIILLTCSYLEAKDLLRLALSCRRFGGKLDCYQQRSLMEEVAMRKLTENATEQQIACIPRKRGESWIGLYNFPPKMENWQMLNQYDATGTRGDRLLLMKLMSTRDLMLIFLTCIDIKMFDVGNIINRLVTELDC